MKRGWVVGVVALGLVACSKSPRPASSATPYNGATTAGAQPNDDDPDAMTTMGSEGCRSSALCGLSGLCSAAGEECVARSDAECRASQQCATDGACTARDGTCVASNDAECRASTACEKDRRCEAHDGYCRR